MSAVVARPVGPALAETIVAVRDVFVAFPGAAGAVMALRGADLTVTEGERLLVQGPNGSGKSTLLKVITGEQPVLAGSVQVGGTELHRLGAARRRRWRSRSIGFIDQHARRALLPELTAVENTALQLRLTGLSARAARTRAHATLSRLGLEGLADRLVPELSGGEAQQVAICAAVAHDPHLLLADEPTGELDEASARRVYAMLTQLAGDGTSLVMVSHDPRSTGFADRIVAIRDGRLAEQWAEGFPVEQVPDSRGWIRIPPQLLTTRPLPPLVATAGHSGGESLITLQPGALAVPGSESATVDAPLRAVAVRASKSHAAVLELAGVAAAYPGRPLFSDLDLALSPGDWLAVTGPSGSGKSTLLSLAAGMLDPVAGEVSVGGELWAGRDRSARAAWRRTWVALAPQRPTLVEPLTVRENLNTSLVVRGKDGAGDPGTVATVAAQLGLTPLLDQPVDRLSGGERQRAALARCLVSSAPLLIVDEPTSQQDEASAAQVIAVLTAEVAAGRTVLAATHDPRFIAAATRRLELGG